MASTRSNYWLDRRVLAYAHQGGAWEAPSSTLFAIRSAIGLGATGIELDVHATLDRQLVVCHDASVDRTTNGSGHISELTLAQLRNLDNAHWWAPGADVTPGLPVGEYPLRGRVPGDPELGIATLVEVLELLDGHPEVVLNLDIKGTAPDVQPYEDLLAATLADFDRTQGVIVTSFHDSAVRAFSEIAPGVDMAAGPLASAEFWRDVQAGVQPAELPYAALQVPISYAGYTVVDERFVASAHRQGVAVHVWTINEEKEMDRLVDLGVDGIITDLPALLVGLLARKGVAWRI